MTARTREALACSHIDAGENWSFRTVWIQCPSTRELQKYKGLVDTGAQCTLIPLGHVGTESVSIAGATAAVDSVGS